jgi:hypothetical protein
VANGRHRRTLTPKEFGKYLQRDIGCLHCGETETVSPNHRANRGMGGSQERDVPSNIIVLCSRMNFLIEADARYTKLAIDNGWKLKSWQEPLTTPVFDTQVASWVLLDNNYNRKVINRRETHEH